MEYVRKGGTIVLFGGCKSGAVVRFKAERLHYDEITLKGTFHFTPRDVAKAFGLLRDRKVDVRKLISGTFPLKDIKEVFAKLAKGDGIKYVLVP